MTLICKNGNKGKYLKYVDTFEWVVSVNNQWMIEESTSPCMEWRGHHAYCVKLTYIAVEFKLSITVELKYALRITLIFCNRAELSTASLSSSTHDLDSCFSVWWCYSKVRHYLYCHPHCWTRRHFPQIFPPHSHNACTCTYFPTCSITHYYIHTHTCPHAHMHSEKIYWWPSLYLMRNGPVRIHYDWPRLLVDKTLKDFLRTTTVITIYSYIPGLCWDLKSQLRRICSLAWVGRASLVTRLPVQTINKFLI